MEAGTEPEPDNGWPFAATWISVARVTLADCSLALQAPSSKHSPLTSFFWAPLGPDAGFDPSSIVLGGQLLPASGNAGLVPCQETGKGRKQKSHMVERLPNSNQIHTILSKMGVMFMYEFPPTSIHVAIPSAKPK